MREFNTFDEALAALYADLKPGGCIDLHEEHCSMSEDIDSECDCTPIRLTSGASA